MLPRFLGVGLAIAFYFADTILRASGGGGVSAPGFLIFLGPGALAAWVAQRQGRLEDAEKEAVLTGLVTAHFASALLVVALVLGVLNIDWTSYQAQVGPQIADGVRASVVPAAAVAGLVSVIAVYIGCVALSWLGALLYKGLLGRK